MARIAGWILSGALLLGAGSAAAQQVAQKGFTGAEVRSAAAKVYQGLELTEDPYGDPMIIVQSGVKPFLIGFYACDGAQTERCQILRFLTYEQGPFGEDKLQQVNTFNTQSMFGRAAIDEDRDIAFDWVVTVAGVSQAYLEQQIVLWENIVLKTFVRDVLQGGQNMPRRDPPRAGGLEAMLPESIESGEGVLDAHKTATFKDVFEMELDTLIGEGEHWE